MLIKKLVKQFNHQCGISMFLKLRNGDNIELNNIKLKGDMILNNYYHNFQGTPININDIAHLEIKG